MTSDLIKSLVVQTLVDITKTGILSTKDPSQLKERNQQRNWETITQVLNLRTQLLDLSDPILTLEQMEKHNFGSVYKGKRRVWTFTFDIEFSDIFGNKDDPLKLLRYDFEMVPIITGLNESPLKGQSMFVPDGEYKNVHFSIKENG